MMALEQGSASIDTAIVDAGSERSPALEISSDDELELALVAVEEGQEDSTKIKVVSQEGNSLVTSNPASEPISSPFKLPPNPAVPQDLSIIAEFVNSYQAVGSLPPLSMTASEKRKAVEASIRAKMAALQEAKGKNKEIATVEAVEEEGQVGMEVDTDGSDSSSEFESDIDEEKLEKPKEGMTAEEHAAIKTELDRLVSAPQQEADSDEDSDSSSEYETDDSDAEGEAKGPAEFVFSDSPPPTPRKRPLKYEVIEDDEEPVPSGPILSANEAPLPPVPQPPFGQLPVEEKLSLAGEIVSWMREKKVEAWWARQNATEDSTTAQKVGREVMEEGEVEEEEGEEAAAGQSEAPVETRLMPKFGSSGTIVVRAMQERPGQEGWLEEGSVVCYSDGKVLGFVSDTFGPLTSPFYSIRLPPPPFPYPQPDTLSTGTRVSYPINPAYRSFVNMLAVRDPRFKGSDASNIHDEEIGEEEMEWSDDEMEAEAKKRKKNKRSDSAREKSWTSTSSQAGPTVPFAPLPPRPHFDYNPDDSTDAASFYGDEIGETEFDDMASVSEAGSSASRRPAPMPYDLDEPGPISPIRGPKVGERAQRQDREGGDGGRGRGRGQGRQRGGGRGGGGREDKAGRGGRGGRGGGRGRDERGGNRGRGRGGSREDRGGRRSSGSASNVGAGSAQQIGRPGFNLPSKPTFDPLSNTVPAGSSPLPTPPPSAYPAGQSQGGYNPPQPSSTASLGGFRLQPQSHYAPPPAPPTNQTNQHYTYHQHQQQHQHQHQHPPQHQQFQHHHANQQPYPSFPPPPPPHFPPQHMFPQQTYHQPPVPPVNDGPAINPRFAAQYQQMQMMSQLAAWGGQGQGGGHGQGQGGEGGYGGN